LTLLPVLENLRYHVIRAQQHVVVPESQHAIALTLQGFATPLVVRQCIEVLSAIQLDHQPRRHTDEVHDIAGQRILATELVAVQLLPAQKIPEAAFGIGAVVAQAAGIDPYTLHG
jgi:hypothetical protein